MTILYIDDDVEDIEIFRDAVQSVDPSIDYIGLSSAKEALTYLKNETVLPDNIFLDMNMPGMDGKQCLEEIRSDSRLNGLPVMVYSTNSFPKDIAYIQSLDARFVRKANSFNELCEIIKSLL